MKRSTDRILVTHVGSLVRPPAVREIMAVRDAPLNGYYLPPGTV